MVTECQAKHGKHTCLGQASCWENYHGMVLVTWNDNHKLENGTK